MKSNPKPDKDKKIIQEQIFENLREVFADYAEDGVPEEMQDMIRLLRAQDLAAKEQKK